MKHIGKVIEIFLRLSMFNERNYSEIVSILPYNCLWVCDILKSVTQKAAFQKL